MALERQHHPTTEPGVVWVYQYVYWDEALRSHRTSTRFATLDAIRCGLGQPVNASAKKVAVCDLIDGAFLE
jgi:hypothetical protein